MKPEITGSFESWEQSPSWRCPSCGGGLPREALAAGQRLARCRQCGQMLRRTVRRAWPVHPAEALESAPTPFAWGDAPDNLLPGDNPAGLPQLETAPTYPYPALQCPYCEHVNQDTTRGLARTQQYCANCSADLKKTCLNCDASMYVLDYFCTRCRSDQEKLKYEIEGMYWQHYNEGKRLAGLGRWEDAERELSLFFDPPPEVDGEHARRARQIYISSIAPYDNGEGLQLYNETVAQLRRLEEAHRRTMALRRQVRNLAIGGGVGLLALFSSLTLGSWWAIFVLVPLFALVILFIAVFLLGGLG